MSQKRGNILVIVLAVLLLVSISAAGYFYWQNNKTASAPAKSSVNLEQRGNTLSSPDAISDEKPVTGTYNGVPVGEFERNSFNSTGLGLSFQYPKTAKVELPKLSADFQIINTLNVKSNSELKDGWVIDFIYGPKDETSYSSKSRAEATMSFARGDSKCQTTDVKNMSIGGKNAYYYDVTNCFGMDSTWYYVTGIKYYYEINATYVGDNEVGYKNIIQEIISSIQFL